MHCTTLVTSIDRTFDRVVFGQWDYLIVNQNSIIMYDSGVAFVVTDDEVL